MKKETYIRIGKKCTKGICDPMCPHKNNYDCKKLLILDAVKIMATDVANDKRKED